MPSMHELNMKRADSDHGTYLECLDYDSSVIDKLQSPNCHPVLRRYVTRAGVPAVVLTLSSSRSGGIDILPCHSICDWKLV